MKSEVIAHLEAVCGRFPFTRSKSSAESARPALLSTAAAEPLPTLVGVVRAAFARRSHQLAKTHISKPHGLPSVKMFFLIFLPGQKEKKPINRHDALLIICESRAFRAFNLSNQLNQYLQRDFLVTTHLIRRFL